jgi:hypothetical protein
MRWSGRLLAGSVGIAAGSYLAYVAYTFARYGHGRHPSNAANGNALLDRVMSTYEVWNGSRCSLARSVLEI